MKIKDGVLTKVGKRDIVHGKCVVPKKVKKIVPNAFDKLDSLTKVILPEGLEKLDDGTFSRCQSLREINIPKSVTSIGEGVFCACTSLQEITLPMGLKTIKGSTFYDCTSLEKIIIPDSVTSIDYCAFQNCKLLREIILPNELQIISDSAFQNCQALEKIIIPEGVISIEEDAFHGCTSLRKITFPEGLKNIWEGAFYNCLSVKKITLSKNIGNIGEGAFGACPNLDLNIETSLFYFDVSQFKCTFDVKSLTLYNKKIDFDKFEYDINSVRKEELEDKINDYLLTNNDEINDYLRKNHVIEKKFSDKSLNDFIDETLAKMMKIPNYNYTVYMNNIYKLFDSVVISENITNLDDRFKDCPNLDLTIQTSLFSFEFEDHGNKFRKAVRVKSLTIYNTKINFYNYYDDIDFQDSLNEIRQRELMDKICNYLASENITDNKCFEYEEHKKFINKIIAKLDNHLTYDYRKDFNDYITAYVIRYKYHKYQNIINKANNQQNMQQEFLDNDIQDEIKSIHNEENNAALVPLSHQASNNLDNEIPIELYEYGEKVGMLDEIEQIRKQIDKYLRLHNIPFRYTKHASFIKEMIESILNDSNYNYNEAIKNYIKYYISNYKDKNKINESNSKKEHNVVIKEGQQNSSNNSKISKIDEQIKQLLEERNNLVRDAQNIPRKISLEKPPIDGRQKIK